MKPKSTPQSVLNQIAQIQVMEKGVLSIIREGPKGPYYNHQFYENGKNVTRYVPKDQLNEIKEGLAGFKRFESLVQEYAQIMIEKSRAERTSDSKKNATTSSGSRPGN